MSVHNVVNWNEFNRKITENLTNIQITSFYFLLHFRLLFRALYYKNVLYYLQLSAFWLADLLGERVNIRRTWEYKKIPNFLSEHHHLSPTPGSR